MFCQTNCFGNKCIYNIKSELCQFWDDNFISSSENENFPIFTQCPSRRLDLLLNWEGDRTIVQRDFFYFIQLMWESMYWSCLTCITDAGYSATGTCTRTNDLTRLELYLMGTQSHNDGTSTLNILCTIDEWQLSSSKLHSMGGPMGCHTKFYLNMAACTGVVNPQYIAWITVLSG